jgi:recombination protein RecA
MAKRTTKTVVEEITETSKNKKIQKKYTPINADFVVSTGSTLVDLAISGNRVRGGGLPGGILVEAFGDSSAGKTALLSDVAASIQNKKGTVTICDPEARLDKTYCEIYGLDLGSAGYERPDTVNEMISMLRNWEPEDKQKLHLFGADSTAALSSELEMSDDGDKRGQKRAKDFSQGMRIISRQIADPFKIVWFNNQIRTGDMGQNVTSGGHAIKFHASLRLYISRSGKIEKQKKIKTGKTIKKVIGVESAVQVVKSSVDEPFKKVPLFIVFNVGIDDIRGNLVWLKDVTRNSKYPAVDKEYANIYDAIAYIEKENLEKELREDVIDMWEEIEEEFRMERKKKVRF